ncbi:MAG TPA: DUF2178 domain-containing protein [Tenuifilaceae bacterium]|nr:DUF2178 domain-containing protein [Tenuifilaceae bacterium]
MKKLIVAFALLAFLGIGFVVFKTTGHLSNMDTLSMVIFLLLVGVGIGWLIKKVTTVKKSEKIEDELSKRILEKTSSLSFYVSIYLWLVISILSDRIFLPLEQIVGYGLIGMAFIYFVIWSFYKVKGFKDE